MCQRYCHYPLGFHCFIPCCDDCGKIYPIEKMNIQTLRDLFELGEKALETDLQYHIKDKIKIDLEKIEDLINQKLL